MCSGTSLDNARVVFGCWRQTSLKVRWSHKGGEKWIWGLGSLQNLSWACQDHNAAQLKSVRLWHVDRSNSKPNHFLNKNWSNPHASSPYLQIWHDPIYLRKNIFAIVVFNEGAGNDVLSLSITWACHSHPVRLCLASPISNNNLTPARSRMS